MDDIFINLAAIAGGILFAKILLRIVSKKKPQKETFIQEYNNILNNPKYKVKGNN